MDPTTPTRNPHIVSPQPTPIEAWNDDVVLNQAADLLKATSISTPQIRGRSAAVTLDIPLDDNELPSPPQQKPPPSSHHTVYKRREPIRRDSQNRRNALLKGKEGSRRRQRWENDRLLSNPHAQPPLPSDWEVRPTHNAHNVPYFLAPLWDTEFARKAAARKEAARPALSREEAAAQKVKRELKAKLKRAAGAKGLLQDLEEEVRGFVVQWEEKQRQLEEEGVIRESSSSSSEEVDSEDEEIVFVGRNGAMSDEKKKKKKKDNSKRRERKSDDSSSTPEKDKLIFQSLVDDHGASFGRYLVHAIAIYYGLKTWSVSTTDGRREAYVGLKEDPLTRRPSLLKSELPRPLWAVV